MKRRQIHGAFCSYYLPLGIVLGMCVACVVYADAPVTDMAESHAREAAHAWSRGASTEAIDLWLQAASEYHDEGNLPAYSDAMQNAGVAYQSIGQVRQAYKALRDALQAAEQIHDERRACLVLASLGSCLTFSRSSEEAQSSLDAAMRIAMQISDVSAQATILNNQGNLLSLQNDGRGAADCYLKSAQLAESDLLRARAHLNAGAEFVRLAETANAIAQFRLASAAARQLPEDAAKADLLTGLGKLALDTGMHFESHAALTASIEISDRIGSPRHACYAWGYLGELYESTQRLNDAMLSTRKALLLARQVQSVDALYRWDWQLGRLLRMSGDPAGAIAAYGRAVQSVQSIRHDLSMALGARSSRYGFRQNAGAVFYELADLLLTEAKTQDDSAIVQDLLRQARSTMELLKGAELEDYFQEDCINLVKSRQRSLDTMLPPGTAAIYFIPLKDRVELLVSSRGHLEQFSSQQLSREQLEYDAMALRRHLEDRSSDIWRNTSRKLYDALLKPLESRLESERIDTLVFVPDGHLRTIPMSSLVNANGECLISKFSIAVSPGLLLTATQSPSSSTHGGALAAGISRASPAFPDFPALPSVDQELNQFQQGHSGTVLRNEQFVRNKLREAYSRTTPAILHFATHAQFQADASKSFLMMWDEKLSLSDLQELVSPSQFRGRPLDLICLSGCETAAGDDSARAALGLGGVAVKSGARSALATLWAVDDKASSVLVASFYQKLRENPSMGKARALRLAQLELMKDPRFEHPSCWAPYLLIGNWE